MCEFRQIWGTTLNIWKKFNNFRNSEVVPHYCGISETNSIFPHEKQSKFQSSIFTKFNFEAFHSKVKEIPDFIPIHILKALNISDGIYTADVQNPGDSSKVRFERQTSSPVSLSTSVKISSHRWLSRQYGWRLLPHFDWRRFDQFRSNWTFKCINWNYIGARFCKHRWPLLHTSVAASAYIGNLNIRFCIHRDLTTWNS